MSRTTTYADPAAHAYLERDLVDLHHQLILDRVLGLFGARPGDSVAEVGAGSGRYTRQLLARNFSVTAIEPDPILAARLERRLAGSSRLTIERCDVRDCASLFESSHLVCGFHTLHHLDDSRLRQLGRELDARMRSDRRFLGWFFLEPNPLCPLYLLHIGFSRAMTWNEERGIWTNDYSLLGGGTEASVSLGSIGVLPPWPVAARLPRMLQRSGTGLSRALWPFKIYRVFGARAVPATDPIGAAA